ncbi:MAG: RidA family protein, partial [Opitutaceae bacterium]|nr:RidA family protein [Opitutaceae bacterium]
MSTEQTIAALNITLPPAPAPAGNYLPVVQSGNLLHCSGTLPVADGSLVTGKLGRDLDIPAGQAAARACVLNALANIRAHTGSLDHVARIVSLTGYVNATPDFPDAPAVINGASDLLVALFGENGKHARAAVAVANLPKNAAVEIALL